MSKKKSKPSVPKVEVETTIGETVASEEKVVESKEINIGEKIQDALIEAANSITVEDLEKGLLHVRSKIVG